MPAPRRIYIFLAIGLVALSQSANIIRLGEAHAVAISSWRLVIATLLLLPLANKRLTTLKNLDRFEVFLLFVGGISLSLHFFAWIYAVQTTTVANATLFLSINPVITSSAAYLLFKEKASKQLIFAIALGILGVGVLGGSDLTFSPSHIEGDLYALLSSLLFTIYFMVAKKIRKKLDTDVYAASVYGIAAFISVGTMLVMNLPLVDYTPQTWMCFGLMALIPTMIGHTSLNASLRYIDAGRISAFTLVEPCLAGLVAWFAWGEAVTPLVFLGYGLICSSVLMVAFEKTATNARSC